MRHAGQLLAAFGVKKSLDRPDNNSVHMLVIAADVPAQREDLYLRNKMAAEIGARDVLGEWTAIRIALYGLQTMMARAEHGAAIAARDKGAPRKAPAEEVYLVGALHGLYVRVTGDKRWYTVDDGVPGGPFVEFVQAVAAHIHDNLDAADPPMPAELARNLETLSKSARRIVDRIRRVPKRWKGTNQSQPS